MISCGAKALTRRAWTLAAVLGAASCKTKTEPKPAAKQYPLRGEVIKVDAARKSALIRHEDIPGFMKAMTMEFPVPDQADLDRLKPGVTITATVHHDEAQYKYWLAGIQVIER